MMLQRCLASATVVGLAVLVVAAVGDTASERPDGTRAGLVTAVDTQYKSPINLTISPDGARLYVVCENSDSVQVVATDSQQVEAEIPVGRRPYAAALSPDGGRLYVTNRWDDTVSVVDTASLEVTHTVPLWWGSARSDHRPLREKPCTWPTCSATTFR